MIKLPLGLLKPLLKTGDDVARNRLLNQHTPRGVLLLVGAGYLFDVIDEHKLNVIISLLAGTSIGYSDIYLFLFNCAIIYAGYKGVMLIFKRAEKWVNEAPFKGKNNNDKNNMSFTRL